MNNQKSLERLNKLHLVGQAALARMNDIPLGTTPNMILQQNMLKKKVLSYFHATESDWNDWNWQMEHKITQLVQLEKIISLKDSEKDVIRKVSQNYRFAISPYYMTLIDPENPWDGIGAISLPSLQELFSSGTQDPSGEEHQILPEVL